MPFVLDLHWAKSEYPTLPKSMDHYAIAMCQLISITNKCRIPGPMTNGGGGGGGL